MADINNPRHPQMFKRQRKRKLLKSTKEALKQFNFTICNIKNFKSSFSAFKTSLTDYINKGKTLVVHVTQLFKVPHMNVTSTTASTKNERKRDTLDVHKMVWEALIEDLRLP